MPLSLKILTVMIRAHDGCAECSLNWNIYEIGVNCEFQKNACKNERHC